MTDSNERKRRRAIARGDRIDVKELYDRHRGLCAICGQHCTTPTIDHVIPLSKGGTHTWGNVQLACYECNQRKGNG